eukprot:TRINITY_DN8108_c0_g1_i2.p1 TRINITY_DN8108_c0_g1~~TRINITY_DN8108_c0_g1_i2.p1  ORF type:complete len:339 (-),score=91.01 TRINITY_DN8108_c0_g1_i2:49-1065(-)
MEYRQVPGTDLKVSTICYGTWNFGDVNTWGRKFTTDEAKQAIDTAIECGINFFDCAEAYGAGRAEKLLGKAIAGRHDRSKLVIATKFGLHQGENAKVYSEKDIEEALSQSLARLQTNYVDLYQVHWSSNIGNWEEVVRTLNRLKEEGKIRHIGVCNFSKNLIEKFKSAGGFSRVDQVPYNLIWRAIEYEVIPYCKESGIGLLTYSPQQQGLLSGRYTKAEEVPVGIARSRHFHKDRSPQSRHGQEGAEKETFDAIAKIREIASKAGVTMSQLALAWVLSNPAVVSVIIGASSPDQLKQNAQLIKVPASVLEECTKATEELKEKLGPNPDLWALTSRYT